MSLIRTGHAPGAWRDEGPAAHVSRHGRIGAQTVTGFVPYIGKSLAIPTPREALRSHERTRLRGERLLPKERPICGAPMRYEETCARMTGHRDSHRSRTVMDTDRASRAAGRRDLVLR